jgi:hypothetical protein
MENTFAKSQAPKCIDKNRAAFGRAEKGAAFPTLPAQ